MNLDKPGTPGQIRDKNRGIVLEFTERYGPASRADISRATGISQPTVSGVVEDLLRQGVLAEIGAGPSTGGRRPTLLRFEPRAAYVVGIDLGGTNVKLALTDLAANIVERLEGPSIQTKSGRDLSAVLVNLVRGLIASSGVAEKQVLGVGVGVPGITDPITGRVSLARVLGWERDVSFREALRRELGLPVIVENDVNAAAIGEKLAGTGSDLSDFVFVSAVTGIGAGIVLNGQLYRGHLNAAGEIGYMVCDPAWIDTRSDGFGCLENVAGPPAIVQMVSEHASLHPGSSLVCRLQQGLQITAAEVFLAASRGEELGVWIIERLCKYLGIALASIVAVLSPQAIVLGGDLPKGGDLLIPPLNQQMAQIVPFMPEILISSLGDDAGLVGAASIAIQSARQILVHAPEGAVEA